MLQKQSYIPQKISNISDVKVRMLVNIATVLTGTLLMSLLAQISIRLPWTPVPITGQTFGVALVALLWGRERGAIAMLLYLFTGGVLNLPVFANGGSGLLMGPSFGYLLGMAFAALAMGTFADRGWTNSFLKTYLAIALGSAITFAMGLFFLSYFVPNGTLLAAGLWPFLPGDLVKSLAAAAIVRKLNKNINIKESRS